METILRTTILYWFILFIIRIVPRRTGNITTPFEYILVFLQGGMAIGVIVVNDHSLTNALVGISTIAVNHIGIALLKQRSERFGHVVDGGPLVVLQNGQYQTKRMEDMLIQPQDILSAARAQGITQASDIKLAVLERNGSFSVIKKEKEKEKNDQGKKQPEVQGGSAGGAAPAEVRR